MTMFWKRLLCIALILAMSLSAPIALAAEKTTLTVELIGLYAQSSGGNQANRMTGDFEVLQNGQVIAVAHAGEAAALDVSGQVTLRPVKGSMAPELRANDLGYTAFVRAGEANAVPVMVFADAGLFTVEAGQQASFTLTDPEEPNGKPVLSFDTDETGHYALPVAIPAGIYTLTMVKPAKGWAEKTVEIKTYSGADSIVHIDAAYQYVPPVAVEETVEEKAEVSPEPATATAKTTEVKNTASPTAAPTATPTVPPTVPPTAEPTTAPTAKPTSTPTATPAPTATPRIPVGTMSIEVIGGQTEISYHLTVKGQEVTGQIASGKTVQLTDIPADDYLVTVTLPDGVVLTSLNGFEQHRTGEYQWMASVADGEDSLYRILLNRTGSVQGRIENVEGSVSITASSDSGESSIFSMGDYVLSGLVPGVYTITWQLPAGTYTGETVQFSSNKEGVTAAMTAVVTGGDAMTLPTITRILRGEVSGMMTDSSGKPAANLSITLTDETGAQVASAVSGTKGEWSVTNLPYGDYIVRYHENGYAAERITISDASRHVTLVASAAEPTKITVYTFLDANNNGTRSNNEDSFAAVRVELISLLDGTTVVAGGETNTQGQATLQAPAGTYLLRAYAPAEYGFGKKGSKLSETHSIMTDTPERVQISTPLSLTAGETAEVGVGLVKVGSVTGTVWLDENADGLWQADEPGVAGMRITLKGVRNSDVYETLTDENGEFSFRQLSNGTYDLTYCVPDEYVFTVKANGNMEQRSRMTTEKEREGVDRIEIEGGESLTDRNVGLIDGAIIEGICFLDANYNGVYDEGEIGLSGVELRLTRQSNNVLLQTATSDANGVYRFYGQRGSTFGIRAQLPSGYSYSIEGDGEMGNRFTTKEKNEREHKIGDITLENGEHTTVMLGAIAFGSMTGVVYRDDDYSGAWQTGEALVQGVNVTLYNAAGERIASSKTNRSGTYLFDDLVPGEYTLRMTPENGYAFTALGDGNVMQTTADGKGVSRTIVLDNGQNLTQLNIGQMRPAKVAGIVFADENDNGLMDKKEKGLVGTTVRLMNAAGEFAAVTIGEAGDFAFPAMIPGEYYLAYELPEGCVYSNVTKDGHGIEGGRTESFTVAANATYTAPLCGGLYLSRITGAAYADPNGNGVLDAGETFQPGVTLILTPERSDLSALTVVTGEDGSFAFENIRPDTYSLTVQCPAGSVLSRIHGVDLPLKQGKAEQTVPLKVTMGSAWTEQFLGCVLPSSWSGDAYYDENDNGLRDAADSVAPGETVWLMDASTGELLISAMTDENGRFTMEGIAPGHYRLAFPMTEGLRVPRGGGDFTAQKDCLVTDILEIWSSGAYTGATLAIVRETELSGHVWLARGNKTEALAEVPVQLLSADGAVLAQTTSDADGAYHFPGLMPADYRIRAVLPASVLAVYAGDPLMREGGLVSIVTANDGQNLVSDVITVRMAKHQRNLDIGAVLPGKLGDRVWLDLNKNGLQDGDEEGVPNITIVLLQNGETVATTTSDQYGFYVFEGIYPTEYTLHVTWPEQIVPTVPRTDLNLIVSILWEDGSTLPVLVPSDGANYNADLGFVLVNPDEYPAGYGEGATQDWTYEKPKK